MTVLVVHALLLPSPAVAAEQYPFTYTVQPGDTLNGIVWEHTGSENAKKVAKDNRINNADHIVPGMKIRLKVPKWTLKKEEKFRDYTVRVFRAGAGFYQILKNGRQIFADSGSVYQIGTNYEDEPASKLVSIGRNVTGDGQPNLLISDWTGGAHCCFSFHLYQIGDNNFRLIQTFNAEDTDYANFINLDDDPALEFRMFDWTFAYWRTSFANSPSPEVILKYNGNKYEVSYSLMRKPPLPQNELSRIAAEIATLPEWKENPPPVRLWEEMLTLIYSGNMPQAWNLAELSWPKQIGSKDEFLESFKKQLQKSPYWESVRILNQK